MKKQITHLLILMSIQMFGQNNYNKVPENISFQINKLGNDSIEVIYNVDFKERKGVQVFKDKPRKPKKFKKNENFTFKLPKDSVMKITIPPYFLTDTIVVSEQVKFKKAGQELSYYRGYFMDRTNERVAYTDSIGNGTFIVIPNEEQGSFTAIGAFNLYQRTHSLHEDLKSGEELLLNRIPAIAIRFKGIKNDMATFWIGHDVLKTSKEEPSVSGVRFYDHQIKIDDIEPKFVGHDFRGRTKKKTKKIDEMTFEYIPTEMDRTENGSFILKSTSTDKYRLIGVYSYFGRLFEINHEIAIGEEIGIKKSVPNK